MPTKKNMNKETRIKKIQEIIDSNKDNPFGITEIPWKDKLESMKVYQIPLDYLVFNKYNGRIKSRTKSLEKQNRVIDEYSEEGKAIIEELLWKSKIERNEKTLKDIHDFGQQKVGIITKDGIIIDGNRRAMLLNEITNKKFSKIKFTKKYDYFKAVVLPVNIDENRLEIKKLETSFQMKEDEKLKYNPVEKYLDAKDIYEALTNKTFKPEDDFKEDTIETIANWMGEAPSEIKKYLQTIAIMDEYLEYLEYDGVYTQLDNREDQFLNLSKWLNNFYGESSKRASWGYKNEDVDDLKVIGFDYIRLRGKNNYDGKEFRNLADGNADKHFFGDKNIWSSFSKKHYEILDNIPEESPIDFDSNNLEKHLNARDKAFFDESKFDNEISAFIENLNEHKYQLGYNQAAGAPEKLIKRASQTFDAIKTNHSSFSKPEIQRLVKELAEKINDTIQEKSVTNSLSVVVNTLKNLKVDVISKEESETVELQLENIRKICFDIKKKI